MKKFINDWLVNFALVVLGVFGVFFIAHRNGDDLFFILELLLTTLLIRLLQMLTGKFTSRYPMLEYLLEFGMVVSVVLGSGWVFGWYNFESIWLIIVVIAIVYMAGYVLDLTKANRDIMYINEQIKRRRMEMESAVQTDEKQ
jgi:hypothetical protein